MATVNARELGLEATVDKLRQMLVDRFQVAVEPEAIGPDEPLFAAGVGLSSLEGMELLAEIETQYGVVIRNLDHWVEESPTLQGVARYLIEHSPPRDASP
jgi:acyl carrier protein